MHIQKKSVSFHFRSIVLGVSFWSAENSSEDFIHNELNSEYFGLSRQTINQRHKTEKVYFQFWNYGSIELLFSSQCHLVASAIVRITEKNVNISNQVVSLNVEQFFLYMTLIMKIWLIIIIFWGGITHLLYF